MSLSSIGERMLQELVRKGGKIIRADTWTFRFIWMGGIWGIGWRG